MKNALGYHRMQLLSPNTSNVRLQLKKKIPDGLAGNAVHFQSFPSLIQQAAFRLGIIFRKSPQPAQIGGLNRAGGFDFERKKFVGAIDYKVTTVTVQTTRTLSYPPTACRQSELVSSPTNSRMAPKRPGAQSRPMEKHFASRKSRLQFPWQLSEA